MTYKILDALGNVVDRDLSYEEALLWVDCYDFDFYSMEQEEDQNDRNTL